MSSQVSNSVEGCDEKKLKKNFDEDGYHAFCLLLKVKRDVLWVCPVCGCPDDENLKMIACSLCSRWHHYECMGIRSRDNPADLNFGCPSDCVGSI